MSRAHLKCTSSRGVRSPYRGKGVHKGCGLDSGGDHGMQNDDNIFGEGQPRPETHAGLEADVTHREWCWLVPCPFPHHWLHRSRCHCRLRWCHRYRRHFRRRDRSCSRTLQLHHRSRCRCHQRSRCHTPQRNHRCHHRWFHRGGLRWVHRRHRSRWYPVAVSSYIEGLRLL